MNQLLSKFIAKPAYDKTPCLKLTMSVSVVVKNIGALVEGPHWDDVSQTLYYVDIVGDVVYRYDPATDSNEKVAIGKITCRLLLIKCQCRTKAIQ